MVDPEHPGLYFIGLIQPLGAIMPIAEAQSEWVADMLEGKVAAALAGGRCGARSPATGRAMAKRYVASKRHTIQVDFAPYMRGLRHERRGGGGAVSACWRGRDTGGGEA